MDGLHRRAGSERIVELHGNLFRTRCSRCERPPFEDDALYEDGKIPACGQCHGRGVYSLLRPHIVWFGEMLDRADLERVSAFMEAAAQRRFVFVAVGTSGVVYPAAGFVDAARRHGAETWLVNAEPSDNAERFDRFVQGASGEVLPALLGTWNVS